MLFLRQCVVRTPAERDVYSGLLSGLLSLRACTHSQGDRPLDHLTYTCPSCAYLYLHMVITCSDYILPTSHAMSCHVYLICADVPQGSYE